MSRSGEVNLSPYSFFNIIGDHPHLVSFSSLGRKDSMTFAEEGGDFVCNVATYDLRREVNATSAAFPRGVDEMAAVGLEPLPSRLVRPPRVKASPASLECKWVETIALKKGNGSAAGYFLVIGEVVGVHIEDRLLVDGRLDSAAMNPILRGGYHDYFAITESGRFALKRPEFAGHSPAES
jgi:flavin reductase (DIM6/NTAB) family NADH-FMN oxidoreductase RutF